MASNQLVVNMVVYLVLCLRKIFGLIFFPYQTMRRIILYPSSELFYLFSFLLFIFFIFQERLKPLRFSGYQNFLIFLLNFFISCLFFYFLLRIFNKNLDFKTIVAGYSATLFPTVLFFFFNLFSFYFFPPPRSFSLPGYAFSYVYLGVVMLLVFWKIMLIYLFLRFAGRIRFMQVFFVIALYLAVFSPFYLGLYFLQIIRLPVI